LNTLNPKANVNKLPRDNIGWGTMFMNRHSLFAILVAFLGTFNIMFYKEFMVEELTGNGAARDVKVSDS
jgi:hypothetical protein